MQQFRQLIQPLSTTTTSSKRRIVLTKADSTYRLFASVALHCGQQGLKCAALGSLESGEPGGAEGWVCVAEGCGLGLEGFC
jgi:hypothetical protein